MRASCRARFRADIVHKLLPARCPYYQSRRAVKSEMAPRVAALSWSHADAGGWARRAGAVMPMPRRKTAERVGEGDLMTAYA